jgi:hypothetical protein
MNWIAGMEFPFLGVRVYPVKNYTSLGVCGRAVFKSVVPIA